MKLYIVRYESARGMEAWIGAFETRRTAIAALKSDAKKRTAFLRKSRTSVRGAYRLNWCTLNESGDHILADYDQNGRQIWPPGNNR